MLYLKEENSSSRSSSRIRRGIAVSLTKSGRTKKNSLKRRGMSYINYKIRGGNGFGHGQRPLSAFVVVSNKIKTFLKITLIFAYSQCLSLNM